MFFSQDPDVGTFRAPLSLSALVRILTRLLGPRNEANDNEEFAAMWKSQASFCNTLNYAYGDVVLDNRALFTVVQVHPVDQICPTHLRLAGVKIVKT
jgi:hypothetical protein